MLRRWLAEKLYPEAFEAERRLHFVRLRMSELTQWCGYGFPEIAVALDWIARRERVYFMPLAEYDARIQAGEFNEVVTSDISRFRDEISDRFDRRPDRKVA